MAWNLRPLAYLSTDEVNQALALQLAAQLGVGLELLSLEDGPPDAAVVGMLYDLDYLPPDRKQEVLSELLAGALPCAVAVHSYNLDEDQVEQLVQNGVTVSTRLEAKILEALLQEQEVNQGSVESCLAS
jgi:hypothetical protein